MVPELVHIILRYEGLIAFRVNYQAAMAGLGYPASGDFEELHNPLCREVNGAISHRYLIPSMKTNYGIECILHSRSRCGEYTFIPSNNDAVDRLNSHLQGIIAYDIYQCGLKNLNYVCKETMNHEARNAFEVSMEFLSKIHPMLNINDQIRLSENFFDALGYNHQYFEIMKPFPLLPYMK